MRALASSQARPDQIDRNRTGQFSGVEADSYVQRAISTGFPVSKGSRRVRFDGFMGPWFHMEVKAKSERTA